MKHLGHSRLSHASAQVLEKKIIDRSWLTMTALFCLEPPQHTGTLTEDLHHQSNPRTFYFSFIHCQQKPSTFKVFITMLELWNPNKAKFKMAWSPPFSLLWLTTEVDIDEGWRKILNRFIWASVCSHGHGSKHGDTGQWRALKSQFQERPTWLSRWGGILELNDWFPDPLQYYWVILRPNWSGI